MSGTTAHGIRHPDGSTKAKNLGPELERMADDIDALMFEQFGEHLDPLVREVVKVAVDNYLANLDIAPQKCVHFAAGRWFYDGPGSPLATHYIIRVDDRWRIVEKPYPTPSTTRPAITWN